MIKKYLAIKIQSEERQKNNLHDTEQHKNRRWLHTENSCL
jgi:hypothetical protein